MNFKIATVTFSVFIMAIIIALGTSQTTSTTSRNYVVSSTRMPTSGGNGNGNGNGSGSGSLTTKGGTITSVTTQLPSTTTKGVSTVLPSISIILAAFIIVNLSISSILI